MVLRALAAAQALETDREFLSHLFMVPFPNPHFFQGKIVFSPVLRTVLVFFRPKNRPPKKIGIFPKNFLTISKFTDIIRSMRATKTQTPHDARQENTTMIGGVFLILDNIKRLCREHKTNITNMEKEVGLGFGTVYKWGKVSPSVDNLKLVADYFGVTVDELLSKTEETT